MAESKIFDAPESLDKQGKNFSAGVAALDVTNSSDESSESESEVVQTLSASINNLSSQIVEKNNEISRILNNLFQDKSEIIEFCKAFNERKQIRTEQDKLGKDTPKEFKSLYNPKDAYFKETNQMEQKIQYTASTKNKANQKFCILVEPKDKSNLGIYFWEAEIYTNTKSIFYRLVIHTSAESENFNTESGKFEPIKKEINNKKKYNWPTFQLDDTNALTHIINSNFNVLQNRDDFDEISFSIGRNPGKRFVNLDVKIQSKEKIEIKEGEERKKYRISLGIHIYDQSKVRYDGEFWECEKQQVEYEIMQRYSELLKGSLAQLQGLKEFSEEILNNYTFTKFPIDRQLPCFIMGNTVYDLLEGVKEGNKLKVEAVLKSNAGLGVLTGNITDWSNRTFLNITALQYAAWCLDKEMCQLFGQYLTKDVIQSQLEDFYKKPGGYGEHYKIDLLKDKMEGYCKIHFTNPNDLEGNKKFWQEQVVPEQRNCPPWLIYAWTEEGIKVPWTQKNPGEGVERKYESSTSYKDTPISWWFTKTNTPKGVNRGNTQNTASKVPEVNQTILSNVKHDSNNLNILSIKCNDYYEQILRKYKVKSKNESNILWLETNVGGFWRSLDNGKRYKGFFWTEEEKIQGKKKFLDKLEDLKIENKEKSERETVRISKSSSLRLFNEK